MQNLILEAICHKYKSQKRDAEQLFDFFTDGVAADTDVEEIYNKVDQAVDKWVEADLKLGAISILLGDAPEPFARVSINEYTEVFKN